MECILEFTQTMPIIPYFFVLVCIASRYFVNVQLDQISTQISLFIKQFLWKGKDCPIIPPHFRVFCVYENISVTSVICNIHLI